MNKIKYLSKKCRPWKRFGSPSKKAYGKWNPQVCGICCLKMIGDACGYTNKKSIYQLAMECKDEGGFIELPNGEIQDVYHKPLLKLANNYNLLGKVEKNLNIEKTISSLSENKFVILSINKSKIDSNLKGGHLILLHSYDPKLKVFLVNDPDPILAKEGKNIKIDINKLQEISNKKGLILWPKK
jgi:hypothetical protein